MCLMPDEKTLSDAYVYLLARVLVIRQEQSDIKFGVRAYSQIKYNPRGQPLE